MAHFTWSFVQKKLLKERITFSTLLTLVRIALVPCMVVAMLHDAWGLAFSLFVVAAITDMLDGFLARLLKQETFLGACLDPLADKLLTLAIFSTLTFAQAPLFPIPLWFLVLVLCKELTQIVGAFIIYRVRGRIYVAPSALGKVAMIVQTVFIGWLFACYFFGWVPVKIYYAMLAGVLVIVFASLVQYVRIGWLQLIGK
jgi:cardiolipin synthase (CMP-forming)